MAIIVCIHDVSSTKLIKYGRWSKKFEEKEGTLINPRKHVLDYAMYEIHIHKKENGLIFNAPSYHSICTLTRLIIFHQLKEQYIPTSFIC